MTRPGARAESSSRPPASPWPLCLCRAAREVHSPRSASCRSATRSRTGSERAPAAIGSSSRISCLASGLRVNFVGSLRNGPATLADGNHEGHSGWRIDELHGSVAGWLRTYRPHVVLLLIGTNDIIQEHRVATAPARLAALLDRVHCALPATRIVVSTIPPLADAGDDAQATAYNAALARLVRARAARRLAVSFVDAGRRLTLADLTTASTPARRATATSREAGTPRVRSALARTSKPPRDACR